MSEQKKPQTYVEQVQAFGKTVDNLRDILSRAYPVPQLLRWCDRALAWLAKWLE